MKRRLFSVTNHMVDGKTYRALTVRGAKVTDIPFSVWRDCTRLAFRSTTTALGEVLFFAEDTHLNQCKEVLKGALWTEVLP